VAALLKQLKPSLDGDAVRKAIRAGALVDSQVGSVPSTTWGYGKLRAYQTLYGKDPTTNTAPVVKLSASKAHVGQPVTIKATVTDAEQDSSGLKLRWDEGYDGSWDVGPGPVKPLVRTYDKAGRVRIKAEVRDSGGLTGEAAILLDVLPASEDPDGGVGGAGDGAATEPADDGSAGCGCRLGAEAPGGAETSGGAEASGALLLLLALLVCLRRSGNSRRRRGPRGHVS
jgi:hypothetical protein